MRLLIHIETIWKQTNLDDCAEAFVALAKNSSMTGQSVQIGEWEDFLLCMRSEMKFEGGTDDMFV